MRKKKVLVVFGLLSILSVIGGCKKELTQEEVEQTKYYTDLLSQYNKLEKSNKKLEEQLEEATAESSEDKEVTELLDKISRDSLIKMEIAYGDTTSGSVFTENKGVLSLAKQLANTADTIELYTADDVKLKYAHLYTYTLYDEDNSVFELEVYEGNYVIFKDLPKRAFSVYKAERFGDAFLERRSYYPTVSTRSKMAESTLILRGNKAYENDIAYEIVSKIHEMDKKEIAKKKVKEELKTEYLFYYRGEVVTLSLGNTVIKIQDSSTDKETYYQVSKEVMKEVKAIFSNKTNS